MNMLTYDYLRNRSDKLLCGSVLGLGLALLVGLNPRNTDFLLAILVFMPLFTCPHTPRTAVGRLWWTLHLSMLISLIDVRFSGLEHVWGWFAVLHCMLFAALSFVVRWDPPVPMREPAL